MRSVVGSNGTRGVWEKQEGEQENKLPVTILFHYYNMHSIHSTIHRHDTTSILWSCQFFENPIDVCTPFKESLANCLYHHV